MTFLLSLFFSTAHAGLAELSEGERYQYKKSGPAKQRPRSGQGKKTRPRVRRRGDANSKALKKLLEQDQKILDLLESSSQQLHIKRSEEKVVALKRVRGTLLNSVVAMNTTPTTFIVRIDEGEGIEGAELKCQGQSFGKRVASRCSLMVANEREYPVEVEIWDLDGAQGIIADYVYSGEEKAFLSSSLAAFLQGTLGAAKDQVMTPLGETLRQNPKNQILEGLSNIAQNAREKIGQSGEGKLNIAYINAGKSVLVFFHQSLKLNQEVQK